MNIFYFRCSIYFQVAAHFNRARSSIYALKQKFQRTGSVDDVMRRPRPRVTTVRQDRRIIRAHLRDRFVPATVIARQILRGNNQQVSAQTVRNRLRDVGIRAYRPVKCPLLTLRHKRDRLTWARRYVRLTRADWANVLFVDETRIKLRNADGRERVYRRRGERFAQNCVRGADRFGGGSLMLWGGVSLHTKTPIVTVQGNLNAHKYQNDVLLAHAIPHLRTHRRMALAQDNAPCHSARTTQALLTASNIRLIPMPPKSPDLNPIEHIWDLLKRRVRGMPVQQRLRVLERDVNTVWAAIRQRDIQPYISSMRARCRAVINARGGHTRY